MSLPRGEWWTLTDGQTFEGNAGHKVSGSPLRPALQGEWRTVTDVQTKIFDRRH